MRFKLTEKKTILLAILCFSIIMILIYFYISKPIYTVEYQGTLIGFRANLKEAARIKVYPNDTILHSTIANPSIRNITIVFKDAGAKNGYYILEEFEIINKLFFLYKIMEISPKFEGLEIQDYENLTATEENPIIALIHPIYSNETSIKVKNNVIYLQGTDLKNFDLATIKFLMVALKIEI